MKNLVRIITHGNGRITWQVEDADRNEVLATSAQHFPNPQLAIAAAKRVCTAGASAPVTFTSENAVSTS